MKAYLIARVSTEDQVDALPAQVHRLLDYAKRRAYDYELIEFQESAYKGDREKFKAIISKIQNSTEAVAIVFDKIDRYTRDSSGEEVRILRKLYQSGAIELHFPSDNLVIHKDSPAIDNVHLGFGMVMAQYYSDAISNNVKRRLEQMRRDGEWAGLAPFGYKNITLSCGKKSVEIDTLKADAVRDAFKWYASGNYSLKLVSRKLNESYGIKIDTGKLDRILKNPFYMGVMRVKGQPYPHKYDRVITEQLFEQAEQVREGYHVKPIRWAGLPYPYRGLISCTDCGCRITFEKKKGLYVYGHCTQYKGKHNARYILEEEFTKQLQAVFKSIHIPEEAYQEIALALSQSHEYKKRMRNENLMRIDSEIEKYQTRIERVYEDYIDDMIPKSLYERKFEEYQKSQKALQGKRNNIELVEEDYYSTVTHLLRIAKQAPELFEKADFEQKRTLLNLVLSNLRLDGDLLLWELKKPFDTMAFCRNNNNWLGR